MAQFYVTFGSPEGPCVAVVVARERPDKLSFSSIDDLTIAMEALHQDWELHSAIHLPADSPAISTAWLEQMAHAGRLKQLPQPHGSLVGSRGAETAPND
jgi:hypothetical protein